MSPHQWTYLLFGCILVVALLLDLGVFTRGGSGMSIKKALVQTVMWLFLAAVFGAFVWIEEGSATAMQYTSAYLMEWSLSVDNIFVFVLLFQFFQLEEKYYAKVLLVGIGIAIVLRLLFLSGGLAILSMAHWVLYIFGAFLLYTGVSMFRAKKESSEDPSQNKIFHFFQKYLRLSPDNPRGKISGVILLLAATDVVFALDSIPAVLAISSNPLVVYTSNVFAVLGLRSLFFLLKGAVGRFKYLQQGIAIVLIFIGAKMLADMGSIRLPEWLSLAVIVGCLGGSVLYSLYKQK